MPSIVLAVQYLGLYTVRVRVRVRIKVTVGDWVIRVSWGFGWS